MFPCGHANPVSSRFCAECGGPAEVAAPQNGTVLAAADEEALQRISDEGTREQMREMLASDPRYAAALAAAPPGPPQSAPKPSLPSNSKMRGMKGAELTALAEDAGISTEGTRTDLLARLVAANNASKAPGGV